MNREQGASLRDRACALRAEPAEQSQAEPLVPSAAQIHILRHSLGLTYGEEMYRNHFVTGEGSIDHPDCMALSAAGLMRRVEGSALSGGMDVFVVTDAGKLVAQAHTPKLSRSKKRYLRWLDISDVTGQSFGDWLRSGCAQ
jgi:hypothetical protein